VVSSSSNGWRETSTKGLRHALGQQCARFPDEIRVLPGAADQAARLGSGHGRLCVEAAAWSGLGCVGVVTADNNRGDLGWPCT